MFHHIQAIIPVLFPVFNSAISRMLYKWSQTACNLIRSEFTQQIPLAYLYKLLHVLIIHCILFLCYVVLLVHACIFIYVTIQYFLTDFSLGLVNNTHLTISWEVWDKSSIMKLLGCMWVHIYVKWETGRFFATLTSSLHSH